MMVITLKHCVFLCLAINLVSSSATNEFFTCARHILKNGVWEWDIPCFNPLTDEHPYIDFEDLHVPDLVTGRINMDYAIVEGIPYFVISNMTENISQTSINLQLRANFNRLAAHAEYNGRVDILGNQIFHGDGLIKLELFDVDLNIQLTANYDELEDQWKLEKFIVEPRIALVKSKITGLYNNETLSALVTTALNQDAVAVINDNSTLIGIIVNLISTFVANVFHISQFQLTTTLEAMFSKC